MRYRLQQLLCLLAVSSVSNILHLLLCFLAEEFINGVSDNDIDLLGTHLSLKVD